MKALPLFLLLVAGFQASAQFLPQDEKTRYQLKYEKYRKARTAGVVMTVAGALAFGDLLNRGASGSSSNDFMYNLETVAAEGFLGGGITLVIVGTKKMKQYRLKAEGITPDVNVQRYYKYRRMQGVGLGMVATGIVFGAVGISKLQNLNSSYRNNPYDAEVGVLMVLGGAGLMGTGIPLSIRGTRKMRHYQQQIGVKSLSLGISTQMPGVALAYRF